MPVFVEAISKAIKDFPMINVSVDGDKIIRKKDINIGIATALPNGNLIVPVVKNADQKSLLGIAKAMNNIVVKARNNNLQADDVSEGTYTISNIGTFGNIIGTPIINQPQVAIMAVGSITKKPVVIEVDGQDVIAVRHMMYLSHTYDHRVVDGMLGGMFVKKVADYLEKFDLHQEI
jgi:2-oxoglutarate dehydrogenase E2 component (dihydrolipoamide succinyltransferase)